MNAALRLDTTAIEMLAGMSMSGAPDLLPTIISMFLETTPGILATLREASDTGDLRTLQRASHDLKSTSATLGAQMMASRCARLEAIGRAGLASETAVVIREIIEEFEAVRPMLVALLPTVSSSAGPSGEHAPPKMARENVDGTRGLALIGAFQTEGCPSG